MVVSVSAWILVHADTLYLRNGQVIQGTFLEGGNDAIRFRLNGGKTQLFQISQLSRLTFDRPSSQRSRTAGPGSEQVPAGTRISVRLLDDIRSDASGLGRTCRASLDRDLVVDGRLIAPRGTEAVVEVSSVQNGSAGGGPGQIALILTTIVRGERHWKPVTHPAEISDDFRAEDSVRVGGGPQAIRGVRNDSSAAESRKKSEGASGQGLAVKDRSVDVPAGTQLLFTLAQSMQL